VSSLLGGFILHNRGLRLPSAQSEASKGGYSEPQKIPPTCHFVRGGSPGHSLLYLQDRKRGGGVPKDRCSQRCREGFGEMGRSKSNFSLSERGGRRRKVHPRAGRPGGSWVLSKKDARLPVLCPRPQPARKRPSTMLRKDIVRA